MAGHHSPDEEPLGTWHPKGLKAKAQSRLKARGWTMRDYIEACLNTVIDEPDPELELKAPRRPPEKRRGRPPRTDRGGEHG